MGSVVVGELQAVADVGWLWGEAERQGRGKSSHPVAQNATRVGHPVTRVEHPRSGRITGKRLGERAEAEFLAKAAGMGFGIARPWGDSDRYDFILDVDGRLWRVQVKSAHRVGEDGTYSFRMHGQSGRAYGPDEIDALVAYVAPEKAWYVFPAAVFGRVRSLKLYPGSRRKRSRFEEYREAWGVFRE